MPGFSGDLSRGAEVRRSRGECSSAPPLLCSSAQKGSVSIETTFFILIAVLLFFGAVELGRAISIKHSMDVGCYRAVRYLSFNPTDTVTAVQMIRDEVDNNLLGGGYGDDVQVVMDMPATSFQTEFTVSASLDYQPLVPFMSLTQVTLRAQHSNVVEAYP